MKRTLLLAAALGALLGFAQPARPAQAAVSVGFSIGSGGRHNGFSLSFRSRPDVVLIPSSRVYYAQDANEDVYFYDDAWYCVEDGVWYTADSYQGPFVAVGFSSVPHEIRNVPGSYRRHWEGYAAPAPRYRDAYQDRSGSNRDRGGWNQNRGDGNQGQSWGDRNDTSDRGNQGRGHGANGDHGNRGRGNWNRGGRGWGR
jgi:hypothetical protein